MEPQTGLTLWSLFNGIVLIAAIYLIYRYLVKPRLK
jgi:hypothetical protein